MRGKISGGNWRKISQSAVIQDFWEAILAYETKKYTPLIGFEGNLCGFHIAYEIIQSPNIPQELQELGSTGNLFVSGSTHLVLGIECKERTITVVIVFLLQKQPWKQVGEGE